MLIGAGSNALVHLKPAPVVARVMTATAVLHDDVELWLTRELAVGSYLADLVVPPTDLLPPGPHERDGLWMMTLWTFVAHDEQAGSSACDRTFDLDALTPTVFESPLPAQAIHADASMSNVLYTDSGLLWNDLEDVCRGPVAWDVAGLVASARARGYGETFIEELLAA